MSSAASLHRLRRPLVGHPFRPAGGNVESRRELAELQREVVNLRATVTRLRADQERLDELAHVDAVTGLGNRRAFDRYLEREWELARRHGHDTRLLLADLDRFKDYNDAHGHSAGDMLLREFADVLKATARSTDIVCRIGGDEFALILSNCDGLDCEAFAERVQMRLRRSQLIDAAALAVSLGHASLKGASSPEEALERADLLMYERKQAKKLPPSFAAAAAALASA